MEECYVSAIMVELKKRLIMLCGISFLNFNTKVNSLIQKNKEFDRKMGKWCAKIFWFKEIIYWRGFSDNNSRMAILNDAWMFEYSGKVAKWDIKVYWIFKFITNPFNELMSK